jgi:hypothetical protein
MRFGALSCIIVVAVLTISVSVYAAPALPAFAVNAQGQCGEFSMGDECAVCSIPIGWTQVDACPEGQTAVTAQADCTPTKNIFCCTNGHSGAGGDCGDVVVDDSARRCAFVEDISACTGLPANWHSATPVEGYGTVCPSLDYTWEGSYIDCSAGSGGGFGSLFGGLGGGSGNSELGAIYITLVIVVMASLVFPENED